jgi:hypothetical protein
MLFNNAHDILWIRYSQENIKQKFPNFLQFCKTIKVENENDYGISDVLEDSDTLLEEIIEETSEDLSPLDYEFYEILREGNVITEEEFREYIRKEEKRKTSNEPEIYSTQDGYILYFDQRVIYVDDIIRMALKLYYHVNDEVVYYIEPLFHAVLEKDLDMNESTLYDYAVFIQDIISIPHVILDRMRNALKKFADIEEAKEFLKRDMPSDVKSLSYAILDFLYKITEKMRKSPKRSNQLYDYVEIFKAAFRCRVR